MWSFWKFFGRGPVGGVVMSSERLLTTLEREVMYPRPRAEQVSYRSTPAFSRRDRYEGDDA